MLISCMSCPRCEGAGKPASAVLVCWSTALSPICFHLLNACTWVLALLSFLCRVRGRKKSPVLAGYVPCLRCEGAAELLCVQSNLNVFHCTEPYLQKMTRKSAVHAGCEAVQKSPECWLAACPACAAEALTSCPSAVHGCCLTAVLIPPFSTDTGYEASLQCAGCEA